MNSSIKKWRWKNQYIDLLQTKTEYIACIEKEVSSNVIEKISEIKKNYKNIYCEIGTGSGEHILTRAQSNPSDFWIGFELRYKRIFRTAEKAEQLSLKNIFLLQCDAKKIADIFSPNSLDGVYINFPDPWAKKRRWIKHRLLNQEYLNSINTLLIKDGFFAYKTDQIEYFTETCKILENSPNFLVKQKSIDLYKSEYINQNIATEFERLFISKGYPIYYIKTEKCL
jgi:tRNA (guanine-N7-)-methyltransferase